MADDYDYDLFVIGAGSGGTRASRVAAAHGAKVAVAEEYRVGGTCVIRGCVPKKLLVYGAHFAEDLMDARRFGWDVPDCTFDWKTLTDNVFEEVDRINKAYTTTLDSHGVEIINEHAEITGPNSLTLAGGPRGHRQIHPDRDRRAAAHPDLSGARIRHHLERGVPPRPTCPSAS